MCVEALRGAGLTVIRAGRRPEDAADFRLIELDDPRSVEEGCVGVDLVISTVRHASHAAERLILREGRTLLSTAAMRLAERADLAGGAGDAPGLVILDAALSPGVSSLVLKDLLTEHPDADGVEGAGTFSAVEPSGFGAADDFTYLFGLKRRHPTRIFDFPPPVGRRRCVSLDGPELEAMLFGGLLQGRNARGYMCMLERPANLQLLALNAVGLLSKMPPSMFALGSRWKLRRMLTKPQTHPLIVTRGGQPLAGSVIECSGNYLMSAAAVVVYARALLGRRGEARQLSGVLGVEDVFDLSELRDAFEARGIHIRALSV
jgi:hypothetical protein